VAGWCPKWTLKDLLSQQNNSEERLVVKRNLNSISTFDLRRRINSFRSVDLESASMNAVDIRLRTIMDQYHIKMNNLYLNGLLRARKNNEREDFNHVRELWYPPQEKIKIYGRLNNIGQSLFYASSNAQTAIYELRHQAGDRITVLVVRPKENVSYFSNIVFIGLDRSSAPEVSSINKSESLKNSEEFKRGVGSKNHKKFVLIDSFLEDLLTLKIEEGEEYKYKPTVILAEILFSIPNIDALNYPSVATNLNGINFCTTPEKADEHFYGDEAWVIDILDVGVHPDSGKILYKTKFIKRSKSIDSDGKIEWLKEGDGINYPAISAFTGGIKALDKEPVSSSRK